jgi:hypothetical protein
MSQCYHLRPTGASPVPRDHSQDLPRPTTAGLFFAEWKAPTVTRGSRGLRQAFPNPRNDEAGAERPNFDDTRSARRPCAASIGRGTIVQ